MIAVEGLSFGGRVVVIVGSRSAHRCPSDGEAALLLNGKSGHRAAGTRPGGVCAPRGERQHRRNDET